MIILKAGGYEFVILGPGVYVKIMDNEIWASSPGGPVKLGEYSEETAKEVLNEIISNYEAGKRLFIMP